MNEEIQELEKAIPDRAVPKYESFNAQVSICHCGWDIFICTGAPHPTWLHMATGRPWCGTDELRRPWSAPEGF